MDEINALSSFDGVKMPFSLEAEQAVLGSLLIDPGCMPQVLMLVKGEYFYLPQHQAILASWSISTPWVARSIRCSCWIS